MTDLPINKVSSVETTYTGVFLQLKAVGVARG